MNDFRKMFYETALAAGMPVISSDKCCRLLAWLYVYGGGNEHTVFDDRLREAIFYAQKRLNIDGSERPEIEGIIAIQKYVNSVSDYKNPPEWVIELEKEYDLCGGLNE